MNVSNGSTKFWNDTSNTISVSSGAEQNSKQQIVFGKKYYNLDDNISVWSDFLKLHLHPKSVYVVEPYRHGEYVQCERC